MALRLAEMNDFLQKRQAEDESTQQDIQQAFKELNKYESLTPCSDRLGTCLVCAVHSLTGSKKTR